MPLSELAVAAKHDDDVLLQDVFADAMLVGELIQQTHHRDARRRYLVQKQHDDLVVREVRVALERQRHSRAPHRGGVVVRADDGLAGEALHIDRIVLADEDLAHERVVLLDPLVNASSFADARCADEDERLAQLDCEMLDGQFHFRNADALHDSSLFPLLNVQSDHLTGYGAK